MPVAAQLEFNGKGIAAYDLNTLFIIANGAIATKMIDPATGIPVWAPFADSGSHVWVRIRDMDGEEYEGKFAWLPDPQVTILPPDLMIFGESVMTPIQMAQWRIAFAEE